MRDGEVQANGVDQYRFGNDAARKMNYPKITIAIPTFNRAALLSQTIVSVLKQTYENIEIIVSDNCSTDNTGEVIAACSDKRIVYFRQEENLGMVGNWNFCLQHATGEFFLLLSDDDLLNKNAIESLLVSFSDQSVVLSYSPVSYIDKDGLALPGVSLRAPLTETGEDFIFNALLGKRVAFPAATMFRTKDAKQLGGYPAIGTATDLALHLMIAMQGYVTHNPQPLVQYRMHSQALSYTEQAIHSQVSLVDWVRGESSQLRRYEAQIVRCSVNFIFRWGRFQAIRGNKQSADLALNMLKRLSPRKKWEVWFYFFDTPAFQGAAKIHAKAKQWAKSFLYH